MHFLIGLTFCLELVVNFASVALEAVSRRTAAPPTTDPADSNQLFLWY